MKYWYQGEEYDDYDSVAQAVYENISYEDIFASLQGIASPCEILQAVETGDPNLYIQSLEMATEKESENVIEEEEEDDN